MSMVNSRVLIGGLVASVVMGMIEMVFEAIAGAGFWSPVVFIAATLVRGLQSVRVPVPFEALPVVLGLIGHMMNSVILGIVFAALVAPRLRGANGLVIGGIVYGLAVFVVMWFVLVPLVDPVMLKLNGSVFALSHVMWGAALGLVLSWHKAPVLAPQHAH
jgi:hypothetical protein